VAREVASAVVVNAAGEAFVHRRAYDRELLPGTWDIVGGHLEPGETTLEALERELEEETGWRLSRVVTELGEYTWTGNDGVDRHEHVYLVEVDGDLESPRLERPFHIEYAWVGRGDLDRLMENRDADQTLLRSIVERALEEAGRNRGTPAAPQA
jgi:8-oxo-dGTP pyrophosphatase MutT (NUDIX family)